MRTAPSLPMQVGSEGAPTIEREFLRLADVVVVELLGREEAARGVAVEMAGQPVRADGVGRRVGAEGGWRRERVLGLMAEGWDLNGVSWRHRGLESIAGWGGGGRRRL